jgi:hypothetical protein
MKTVWYCHKDRHTDLCDKIDSTEINLHTYHPMVLHKCVKTIQWEKNMVLQQTVWGQLAIHVTENKVSPTLPHKIRKN